MLEGPFPYVSSNPIFLILCKHARHVSGVEHIVDVFQKPLAHDVVVTEQKHHVLPFHTGLHTLTASVLIGQSPYVGREYLDIAKDVHGERAQ
jgi:hypothetical protein